MRYDINADADADVVAVAVAVAVAVVVAVVVETGAAIRMSDDNDDGDDEDDDDDNDNDTDGRAIPILIPREAMVIAVTAGPLLTVCGTEIIADAVVAVADWISGCVSVQNPCRCLCLLFRLQTIRIIPFRRTN